MSGLRQAESFRDLLVYQKVGANIADGASIADGANIAEAWAKRRYEAHFVSKLSDSDGEQ